MKNRLSALFVAIALVISAQQWQSALPGYHYEFPRDHFNHPDYQTEWWYYTGNLRASGGHRFGFELTFFRQDVDVSKSKSGNIWRPNQIYLAHLALSDIDGREFYHTERLNRAGPGLAGVSLDRHQYWNGNWQVHWLSVATGEQKLQAVSDHFTLELDLKPKKPFVIHGKDGVSQKGPRPGDASHYISFTRLQAAGQLQRRGSSFSVTGLAWFDHEFFTERSDNTLAGWDWFAIQLDNHEELMLYRLRNKSGEEDPYSSGTFVDVEGKAHFLDSGKFRLSPADPWHSPASGANYPLSWKISIPSLNLELAEHTALKNQELFSANSVSPRYWEGAVTYDGQIHRQPVHGVGYLEMTSLQNPAR